MKTDGLFTVASFKVPFRQSKTVRLVIFGDVHRDSPNHAKQAWQSFLEYCRPLQDTIYLGMGDYLDSTSTTERVCLLQSEHEMHETLNNDLQELQQKKVELLAGELAFMKGNLIGLISGNHWFMFSDRTNTDQRLCRALGCTYLGCSSFVRLVFEQCGRRFPIDIWAHHGTGAGRLLGGSINRVDQMREHAEADVYVMGHDHKRGIVPATPRLYLDHGSKGTGLRVKHRQQWLVRSGSFLASYEPGVKNYNVDAARGPCSLGHVELLITPHKEVGKGNQHIEFEIHGQV